MPWSSAASQLVALSLELQSAQSRIMHFRAQGRYFVFARALGMVGWCSKVFSKTSTWTSKVCKTVTPKPQSRKGKCFTYSWGPHACQGRVMLPLNNSTGRNACSKTVVATGLRKVGDRFVKCTLLLDVSSLCKLMFTVFRRALNRT